jgi:hypothetical protein
MALAANGTAVPADKIQLAAQAVNTAQLYNQSYSYMGSRSHATSTSRGRVAPWSTLAGQIPIGFSTSNVLGATGTTPIPEGTFDLDGRILKNVAVAGLAGTVADNGRKVYASDDLGWTLTRPTAPTTPVGFISRFNSATLANVFFYSTEVLMAIAFGGGERKTMCLGPITACNTASAYIIGSSTTGITMTCHGYITSVYAACVRANTDADVSQALNLKINDTFVTGGVVTLLAADTLALIKAGTAVTALNVFHEGDLIQVYNTQTTAGTASDPGTYSLFMNYETELGL